MRGAHVRDPIAHGFVDRVFQRAAARIHPDDLRAHQLHARDVEPLPLHVLRAHVYDAFHAKARRHCRRGHAVLSRARFRDNPALAHSFRQQRLAQAVVDLVRAGMQQIFALDVNTRAAEVFGQPRCELQWRRAPGKISQ